MNKQRRVRRGLGVASAGLVMQLGALLYWTPLTFVIAVSVGVPLVVLGALLFATAVWSTLKEKGAV